MSGLPQPDLNKVISSKCQTFIKQFIASTKPQGEYEFFGSATTSTTRAYEIVKKIESIQAVAIDSNIDINQKKSQIEKAIIDIEKNINNNLRLYVSNNDRARANVERFVSGLKKLNLDIEAALTPNSTISLRGSVQQQTVPKPVATAVKAAPPITNPTNDALQELVVIKQQVDTLSRQLNLLTSQLAEEQKQNKQLNADNQRLTDTNSSLFAEKEKLNLELEKAKEANKELSATLTTTESKNLELSNKNEALKTQLSEKQTNQTANNDTISQLTREISTLKAAASVSGKQFSEKEEEIARLKLGHEQEIAGLNLQHEVETSSLKAMLQASQELLSKQTEQLQRTATDNEQLQAQREEDKGKIAASEEKLARSSEKNASLEKILTKTKQEMEAAQNSANASSDEIIKLNKIQQELTAKNTDLEANIAGLQQQISDQKPQTIPANDQQSNIDELTKAKAALAEQLSKSQAQHRSEIEAVRTSLKVSLTENVDLKTQVHGLTEENSVLRENLLNVNEKATLLETQSTAHLENDVARLGKINELEEQISAMKAAAQLATASSDNMANMADRIRELEQREQRLAVENTILKKQLQKSKPTTAAPLSFSKQRISGIAPRRPDELIEPELLPSITLVTPASPILTTEPINPSITETPTRPSLLENIAQEFKTVTPSVSGGGKVVNIEQIQKEGEKYTDRPYFDRANTQAINLDETNQLQTLFDDGKLKFSDQTNPNKITFSNESMEPSDLQAMVAILQATSRDNKESTLNNVEVILTGKDEDLIQVLQQFHDKLAEAVQGNDDKKICAIKIQDKGEHNKELTDLIKLHNAAADIIHNKEALTPDKKNNILEAIQALQAQVTPLPESNHHPSQKQQPTLS